MKGSPPRWFFAVLGTACLVSLLAVSAFAQIQSGNIFGKAQAKDGSALPGVSVTLTGIGAPQTFVTDATGAFRFLGLSPGTYGLKAELAGFGTATRNGVTVNLGRNADVTMTLNPAASESITVTAEAPLLDVRKTGTGADISKVELEKVPSARDPWVILQQTPGVIMDRNNVGGNESGQQSVYASKGTTGTQSTWNVDGVNITDFAATGSSPAYYDFDAFEEMQITTGGTDPRIMTPGVQLNMVTKRGTNDIKGSARAFTTRKAWQADPKIPSEASGYLFGINEINDIEDDGAEIGGPILRDKLWFWGAFGKQNIDILTPTVLNGSQFRDRTQLKNENLKLNAQPLASNSLTAVDQFGAKIKQGRNVSTTRPPETAWNQNNTYAKGTGSLTDPTLWKIEDTQIIGHNLYLTGLYSKVQGGFQLIADNGQGCATFACGIDSLNAYRDRRPKALGGDNSWHRSFYSVNSLRPQKQYRIDGSAFANTGTVSHELKFGYGYRKADVTSNTAWPGDEFVYNYGSGAALGDGTDTGLVQFMRFPILTYSAKSTDAYIGDTVMVGNLTVQGALRYDQQKGVDGSGLAAANSVIPDLLPNVPFGSSSGLSWTNVSPRLGLTYTLGANRSTLLRGAYSRYVNQLNSGAVTPTTSGAYSYIDYYFNDKNGDNVAQRNEIDFASGNIGSGGFDPNNPLQTTQFTRWASNLKAPYTDEIILGGEHELLTDFSIGVNATYRKLQNFTETIGEHHQGAGDFYGPQDYVLHAPVNATLPNGSVVSLPYYVLAPGVSKPLFNVIRNEPGYYQTYQGLEFTALKRMSNRWMMRGNLTLQDWKQHVSPSAIVDPTITRTCPVCNGSEVIFQSTGSGAKGNVYINSKWSFDVTGAYQIPVIEASLGANLSGRQGYADPYVYLIRGTGGEGTKSLLAPASVDTFRNDNVYQLDLRLAKDLRFQRIGLTLSVDAFNVLNSNTILQRDVSSLNASATSAAPNATSNHVTEVLSPRVFRIGARLSF
ncbi:MAG TPA: carboxypeptidase regulatory-like domain-containing protein [Thermoanaerobaculia bacterium]